MALERDEVCGPNVCFFVRAANWRYCCSEKLCELRLSLVFLSGSPSSRALSCQRGGGGMRTLGREAPAAAAPAVPGRGERPGAVGRAEGVTQLFGSAPRRIARWARIHWQGVVFAFVSCVGLASAVSPVTAVQGLGKGGRDRQGGAVVIKCCDTNPINL